MFRSQSRDIDRGGVIHASVTTTTTSAVVRQAMSGRKRIFFMNVNGAETIWIAKGPVAAVNQGIRLTPGAWYLDEPTPPNAADTMGYLYVGPWSAVAVANTPILSITEEF